MNIRVSHLLFAGVIFSSGAAGAETFSEDRYIHAQSGHSIQSQDVRPHFRKRARHRRQLKVRAAAARFADRMPPRQAVARPQAGERSSLEALIAAKAAAHGVSVELAHAVVRVESNYKVRATGRAGEVGLMQIKYPTARGLGYTGTRAGLYDPATNLEWGLRYLAGAGKLAGGNLCGTLARYQGGHGTRGARSGYCGRVRTVMTGRGA